MDSGTTPFSQRAECRGNVRNGVVPDGAAFVHANDNARVFRHQRRVCNRNQTFRCQRLTDEHRAPQEFSARLVGDAVQHQDHANEYGNRRAHLVSLNVLVQVVRYVDESKHFATCMFLQRSSSVEHCVCLPEASASGETEDPRGSRINAEQCFCSLVKGLTPLLDTCPQVF